MLSYFCFSASASAIFTPPMARRERRLSPKCHRANRRRACWRTPTHPQGIPFCPNPGRPASSRLYSIVRLSATEFSSNFSKSLNSISAMGLSIIKKSPACSPAAMLPQRAARAEKRENLPFHDQILLLQRPRFRAYNPHSRCPWRPHEPTGKSTHQPPLRAPSRADCLRARRAGLMFRVQVKPEMLRWARERAGLSIDALEAKFPNIVKWESGDEQPPFGQLEKLAKATHLPFGYFFLQEPLREEYPIEHFRTVDDRVPAKLSIDLLDTIYLMQRRQAWMREHLVEQGHAPLDFVGSVGEEESPVTVAAKMRDALGIPFDWAQKHRTWEKALGALREHMEDAGIFVVTNGVVGNNTHRVCCASRSFADLCWLTNTRRSFL